MSQPSNIAQPNNKINFLTIKFVWANVYKRSSKNSKEGILGVTDFRRFGVSRTLFFNVLQIDGSNRQKRPIYKSLIINTPPPKTIQPVTNLCEQSVQVLVWAGIAVQFFTKAMLLHSDILLGNVHQE